MAKVHKKKRGKQTLLRIIMILAGVLAAALGGHLIRMAMKTRLILILIGAVLIAVGILLKPKTKHGDAGEQLALELLKKLPKEYHIFTNLEFELRGHHETDLIVAGPNGVTVCEVKYWSGRVDELDERTVRHTHKDGSSENVHSPVHQVIAHYETLHDALWRKGVRVPTNGLVLMMHPDCEAHFRSGGVKVLTCPGINEVKRCLGSGGRVNVEKTVKALNEISL